jgi:hypothetical protein
VAEQRLAEVAHVLDLLGGELIEQVRADALDVDGGRGLQRREAVVGQDGELPAAVLLADLPAHPAALLQPGDGVGQAAAGGQAPVGQLAHPHHPAGRLGEGDEDLVVGVRDARRVLQLPVQPVGEQLGAEEPGAPGALLVGVEPPRLGGRLAGT